MKKVQQGIYTALQKLPITLIFLFVNILVLTSSVMGKHSKMKYPVSHIVPKRSRLVQGTIKTTK
jgi:hypothetical protein